MAALPYKVCSPLCMVPPIALIRLGLQHDGVAFDAGEHYVKQSFRNRYHILTANGVRALSIPVKSTEGHAVVTPNIRLEHDKPWLREHLRSIQAAYGSSPFYHHYIDEVEALLCSPAESIGGFFSQTFGKWCQLLGAELKYGVSASYLEEPFEHDLRLRIKTPADFPTEGATGYYPQVFEDRFAFTANLSVLDLLFNEGPAASQVLLA